jgi:pyridoxine 5-phosphate synthase
MPAKLSVNINKIATLRNSRGGNTPNVLQVAIDCQKFGAEGITVHPRPDERHIRYADVRALKSVVTTEFNIEGNPKEDSFVKLVLEVRPEQVTLVPDEPGQLTSNHGWNTVTEADYLRSIIQVFRNAGIRTSIFVDPVAEMVQGAVNTGTDRIELYTEAYAHDYAVDKEHAIAPYKQAAQLATSLHLGVNAGHDLSLQNLKYFAQEIPDLAEVSIGHALVSDALYYGLQNTIQLYRRDLTPS